MSIVSISKDSPDFSRMQYLLSLSLGSNKIDLKSLNSIANPKQSIKFDRLVKKRNLLTIKAYISIFDLETQLGIKVDPKSLYDHPFYGEPLRISSGYFFTGPREVDRSFQALYCTIAVGRSLCKKINSRNLNDLLSHSHEELGDKFDSIYLLDEDDHQNKVFKYDYIIFDSQQIKPEYIVDFRIDPNMNTVQLTIP